MEIKTLSNSQLISDLKRLSDTERDTTAEIVRYLHEVDSRKLYLELGYSSLFVFCTEALRYSEGSAYRRVRAARCVKENPEILEKLTEGSLTLCAVAEIAKAKPADRSDLIADSLGKSKFEVQKLVATKIPHEIRARETVKVSAVSSPLLDQSKQPERRYTVTLELSENEYKLLQENQLITGERKASRSIVRSLKFFNRLRSPKERLKRREARIAKKKAEVIPTVDTSQKREPQRVTRHIPIAVRDFVLARDGARCTYEKEVIRCCCELDLQIDHVDPFCLGGGHEPENLRVLCGVHNRFVYEELVRAQYGE